MPGRPSREQFGKPDPDNGIDNGRTNAIKGSATPKAPNFQGKDGVNPATGGMKFQGREAVNPATGGGKFNGKRPSGLETN